MALDGALAGDMSTVQTGVLNAAKNAAFFPVRKGLSKHFKEPEATLRSDFWSSAVSVATNLPQFIGNYKTFEKIFEPDGLVEATLSGDLTRATVGLLAVSAYSIQTIYNGKKLIDYKKEKAPWEDFSEATKSETSLWDKFIENGKEITGKAIDGAGKYIPSNALLLRSMNMIVMGAVTGNAAQIVSGIGFMKGARHRGHANKAHDVVNDLVGSELLGEDLDSVYDLPDINVIIERGMHHLKHKTASLRGLYFQFLFSVMSSSRTILNKIMSLRLMIMERFLRMKWGRPHHLRSERRSLRKSLGITPI